MGVKRKAVVGGHAQQNKCEGGGEGRKEGARRQSEKQSGKIRKAPVHCYSFSCSDIIVSFPKDGAEGGELRGEGQ